ncbi:histone H2B type F-M-like isoform X1 [Callithrix jacchus]
MAEPSSKPTSEEDQSPQEPKEASSATAQKQEKRGRRGSGRHHAGCGGDSFQDSFVTYFPSALNQVHQGLSLSPEALSVMECMIRDILDRIATEAGQLARYAKRVTITPWDIQIAVRLLLPGKTGKCAELQGTNAVLSYISRLSLRWYYQCADTRLFHSHSPATGRWNFPELHYVRYGNRESEYADRRSKNPSLLPGMHQQDLGVSPQTAHGLLVQRRSKRVTCSL